MALFSLRHGRDELGLLQLNPADVEALNKALVTTSYRFWPEREREDAVRKRYEQAKQDLQVLSDKILRAMMGEER
jgi:hypothetical protein